MIDSKIARGGRWTSGWVVTESLSIYRNENIRAFHNDSIPFLCLPADFFFLAYKAVLLFYFWASPSFLFLLSHIIFERPAIFWTKVSCASIKHEPILEREPVILWWGYTRIDTYLPIYFIFFYRTRWNRSTNLCDGLLWMWSIATRIFFKNRQSAELALLACKEKIYYGVVKQTICVEFVLV